MQPPKHLCRLVLPLLLFTSAAYGGKKGLKSRVNDLLVDDLDEPATKVPKSGISQRYQASNPDASSSSRNLNVEQAVAAPSGGIRKRLERSPYTAS